MLPTEKGYHMNPVGSSADGLDAVPVRLTSMPVFQLRAVRVPEVKWPARSSPYSSK
jgi:hypothetical protein